MTPLLSVTGPWPGTTKSTSIEIILSQALIQFLTGPAQSIGCPSINRISPVNTTLSEGTCTKTSPLVCAGPTSMSSTILSPTCLCVSPVNVVLGNLFVTPSKLKLPKHSRKYFPKVPISGACINKAAIISGDS